MDSPVEPVIAGSRGFALALLAPLTERIGTRPRIATDPANARPFCSGPGGLVVVEFLGADTLQGIRELLSVTKGVRIVAAVSQRHAAAEAPLRALGVDVAPWDGTAASVVAAVGRQLSGGPSVEPRPVPPAAAPSAAPAPAAAPRRTGPATPSPTAGAPASPRTPAPRAAAATAPSATPAPRAAAAPQAAAPTPAPHPAAPAARAVAPAQQGSPTPRQPHPGSAGTTSPVPAYTAYGAPRASAASIPFGGARKTPVPVVPPPAWPAEVPSRDAAAEALAGALAGEAPAEGSPLAVVSKVMEALTELEHGALAGAQLPVDPAPLRNGAVMKVRLAVALATAPAAGAEVDAAAVSALLGELDAALAEVNALVAGAQPELRPALEAARNALVREAIDFSEAVQRTSPAGTGEAALPPVARQVRARLLSMEAIPEDQARPRLGPWIALGVVVALVGGYHGWTWYQRQAVRATLTIGLPRGMTEIPGPPEGPRVIARATTELPNAADVARFKAQEEARGNTVRESDGMLFITPAARSGAQAQPPATPAPPGGR